MTPANLTLIRLLAAQAVKAHLTAQTQQRCAIPANDSNRVVPQTANSR